MKITRGKIQTAQKVVIYGPEGIGKSTLASKFPDPVFIDTEGSTSFMDVARLDAPKSWPMLLQEVDYVISNLDCCRTLVIDTADWAEKLCIEHILSANKWESIESPGYGKGYVYVKEEFGKLLNALTRVANAGVNVVLTAHAMMRKFEQPDELGSYDRWELKLSRQTAPLVKEWADMLLFANYKTLVINVDNQGALKGRNKAQGGKRVIYTTHHPCWDAKNRSGLPDEIPMDYEAIQQCIEEQSPAPETKVVAPENTPDAPPEDTPVPAAREDSEERQTEPEHSAEDQKEQKGLTEEEMLFFGGSDPQKVPAELVQLMKENGVTEPDLCEAVAQKGYYPADVRIQDYDPEFIDGCLIAAWPQVSSLALKIHEMNDIPF